MKLKKIRSANLIILIFLLLLPYSTYSETAKTKSLFDTQNGQLTITSISSIVDMGDSFVSFDGDVTVTINDMSLTCQKLKLFFSTSLKDTSDENSKAYVDRIIATGSVVIDILGMGSAIAEKVEFYYNSEKIVLTGNPMVTVVRQGDRFDINGKEIIWYINEERFEVKGSKDNKARFIATDKEKGS